MHINDLFKTKKAHFIVEFIFYSIYLTFKYPVNWKTISRSFALINFKASATATFKLANIKDYMTMTSTCNRTCFPNPPGCCMYRLPYERVGPDIKGSRWVAFLLSVSWNWHLHTASGQRVLILFISHNRGDVTVNVCVWTKEDTPSIIRRGCKNDDIMKRITLQTNTFICFTRCAQIAFPIN